MKQRSPSAPMRIRSLLVPLDGPPFAEQALPWAAAIARAARARLRLALVHQLPTPPPLDRVTSGLYARIELALRKSQGDYLRRTVERVRREHELQLAKAILEGAPARALGEYVREVGVDLMVMTTHGVGGIRRAWLGSVADELVRTLAIPMLIIRPREDGEMSWEPPDPGEILVALDGSRRAEAVLPAAAALATLLGARLALVEVVRPVVLRTDPPLPFPTGYDDELTRLSRAQAQDYLEGVAQQLNAQGVPTTGAAVLGTSPFDAIQDAARVPGTRMVALATHGRGGVRRLVLGSVADKLVRGGELPVLLIRPKGR